MKQYDETQIRTVILAGGKGTRLRPLTAVFPKPLVPLGNKPVLSVLLRQLNRYGLKNITICTGYLNELIMAVCGDGHNFGLNINYSKEEEPLGTAGPLGLLNERTDPIIVMNGDLLTTLNFRQMLEFHRKQNSDITVAVFQREVKIDFGVVESYRGKEFTGFREKPTYRFEVSMGVNVIGESAMQFLTHGKYLDMPDLILKVHDSGGSVSCYREDCFWLDIGRMDDYAIAQQQFSENEAIFLGEAN